MGLVDVVGVAVISTVSAVAYCWLFYNISHAPFVEKLREKRPTRLSGSLGIGKIVDVTDPLCMFRHVNLASRGVPYTSP